MLKLSEYRIMLPCYKDEEDSPKQMEQACCKLTEIDMCTVIIGGLSQNLATAYWSAKGQHFPLWVKELLVDLTPMELAVNTTKAKIKKSMVKAAGKAPINNHS